MIVAGMDCNETARHLWYVEYRGPCEQISHDTDSSQWISIAANSDTCRSQIRREGNIWSHLQMICRNSVKSLSSVNAFADEWRDRQVITDRFVAGVDCNFCL